MARQDDLFALILTLNSNEKRKITISWESKGESKEYLKLYQIYLKMKEYSREFLVEQYRKFHPDYSQAKLTKSLADTKDNLMNLILKAMRDSPASRSSQTEVHDLIQEALLLRSRKLYQRGYRMLQKAQRKANLFEFFPLLLEICKAERMILKEWQKKAYAEEVMAILKEEQRIRACIGEEGKIEMLADMLFIKARNRSRIHDPQERQEVEELLAEPQLLHPPQAGFRASMRYHFARACGYRLLANHPQALHDFKAILDLYEGHPHHIKESPTDYKLAVTNYLNSCHDNNAYQDFPRYLTILKKHSGQSPDQQAESFQNLTYLSLLYAINKPDIEYAMNLIGEIENGLEVYKDKINGSRVMAFATNITLITFFTGSMSLARKWNNRVLNYHKPGIREDLKQMASLFQLVLNVEQQLEGLYEDCKRVKRIWKPKPGTHERVLVEFLMKEALKGGFGPQTDWQTFREDLEKLEHKHAIGYQELLLWAKSKALDVPPIELL